MPATIKQIEKALENAGGFQSHAAKQLGITQQAVNDRIKKSPYLQAKLHSIRESYLDLAEIELLKLMKEGNLGALCFYLKCQGKHRGYIERTEVTGKDGAGLQGKIEIVYVDADHHSKSV